jgi:hypothetical protein
MLIFHVNPISECPLQDQWLWRYPLKEDGAVVSWGEADQGGDSSKGQQQLLSGVQSIAAA